MTLQQLYKYQDVILHTIFEKEKELFQGARVILAGGTALARCYLKHRASYDLDFFISKRFDPMLLQRRLRDAGVLLNAVETVTDPMYAAQLHGMVNVEDESLRMLAALQKRQIWRRWLPPKWVLDAPLPWRLS